MSNNKQGKLILILGPSGSGKGTVLRYLRDNHPEFVFPVSCTTRDIRPSERPGIVYDFISRDEFEQRIDRGDFLEWAHVHNQNYYGTLKKPILEALEAGKTVIREVDVQGLKSIRELIPSDQLTSIFLTVSGWDVLKKRILSRSPMSDNELAQRKASFDIEMEWAAECDHVVESVEGKISDVCQQIESLVLEV